MKIATCGCSHSGYGYGKPWHEHLKESFDCEVISSSSGASGNEVNLEKLKHILENNIIDYVVIQLTEPTRMVIGTVPYEEKSVEKWYHTVGDEHWFPYFSFNSVINDFHIKNRFKYEVKIDRFLHNQSFTSDYNTYHRFFQTLMSFQKIKNYSADCKDQTSCHFW